MRGIGAGLALAERGLVPMALMRRAIQGLCERRLDEASARAPDAVRQALREAPIAPVPERANAQHYEVPADFFRQVLGRRLKYSGAYWPAGVTTLDAAESAMLRLTCERAGLQDGQRILDLGCGWGSLSLYAAQRYPNAQIVAVSNSASQRRYLEARRPPNLTVVTADMNTFDPRRRFDRIVSVEMFEHMRNWPALLERIGGWLEQDGRLFVHVFCHAELTYPFESVGADNWMGRHFFSGGLMPAFPLLPQVATPLLNTEARWWLDGTHYQRTAAAWRANLESHRAAVLPILADHYGRDAERWYYRWRLFFLACEELFGYAGGKAWGVGHYRLTRAAAAGGAAG